LAALDDNDPVAIDVREILSAGKRAADLTRQLLAFSRQQVLAPAVVDLNDVVGHMDTMLQRLIGEDIDLRTATPPSIGKVKVDRGQIEQVIMNLAINARDAMPNGGTLTIETADVFLDEPYATSHVGVKVGPHVLLAVADSGVGMTADVKARIFEPFFTTKERGKGTGLGLSTVLGIVEQSGGSIAVSSEPDHGATFRIYFPCTDEDPDSMQLATSPRTLQGSETILLVEDEEQLRALGQQILSKSGYRVLVADSPVDALAICQSYEGQIHLLLTDVVMPLMNGRELAERAARLRPAMKVLYVSGYTDNTIVHHGVLEEGVASYKSPSPDALRRKPATFSIANAERPRLTRAAARSVQKRFGPGLSWGWGPEHPLAQVWWIRPFRTRPLQSDLPGGAGPGERTERTPNGCTVLFKLPTEVVMVPPHSSLQAGAIGYGGAQLGTNS
jgi:CheY-like chemotaxis protein